MVGIRRSTLAALNESNSLRRIGPRPSLPDFKKTPEDEQVKLPGPEAVNKNVRKVKPLPSGEKPRPVGVPDASRAARGLSARGLLAKQPKYQKLSSEDIIIRSLKKTKTRGGLPAIVGRSRDLTTKPIRMHQFSCIGLEKDVPLHKQKRVKISCSCEFWLYYCLSGHTNVLTVDGYKKMYELVRPGATPRDLEMEYIVDGNVVKGSRPVWTGRKKTIGFQFDSGREIRLTKDHQVLSYDGVVGQHLTGPTPGTFWVEAKDVKIGDRIAADVREPTRHKEQFGEDFYEGLFLGVLMGDGTFLSGKPRIVLYGDKRKTILPLLKKAGVVISTQDITCKHYEADVVELNHRALEIIHKYAYDHKRGVKFASRSFTYGYLSGLITTDGCITTKQINLSGGFEYLDALRNELARYGHVRIGMTQSGKAGTCTNLGERKSDLWLMCMSSGAIREVHRFLKVGKAKRAKLKAMKLAKSAARKFTRVKKILKQRTEDVYDIRVPKLNRFVAEGVVVHNCEYALWTWGAANIIFCNGQPAKVKNPSNYPLACKHTTRVLREIIQRNL